MDQRLALIVLFLVAGAGAGCSDDTRGGGRDGGGEVTDLGAHLVSEFDFAGSDLAGAAEIGTVFVHEKDTLYLMDATTYDLTTVGKFSDPEDMTDLAVTPDGRAYTISRTSLYRVDAQTAQATQLFSNIATSNVALTFQTDGTLLASDQAGAVRVIDPVTGDVTELGSYGSGFDTAGDLVAVSDGTMFGISAKGPGSTTTSNVLIKVDPKTGKGTLVGPIGYTGVFGIAFAGGKVLAFTKTGQVLSIDPKTGQGTLVRDYPTKSFWGAGTSPLVPIS